jgi:hypothetical protein
MGLSSEDKQLFNRLLGQLLNVLDTLDRMPANPHAVDLIEIAGSILEQQLKDDIAYEIPPPQSEASNGIGPSGDEDAEADETQIIQPDSPLASFAKQAADADEHVANNLTGEIIQEGGFKFLKPGAKPDREKDIPSPDDLEGWFNI